MTDQIREPLELSISNLGPIESANIQLRPLTVFAGQNGSGKSCAATLIYALHNFFSDYGDTREFSGFFAFPANDPPPCPVDLSPKDVDFIHEWVNSELPRSADAGRVRREMPDSVSKSVNQALRDTAILSESLSDEVASCFGVDDVSRLRRYPYGGDFSFAMRESATRGESFLYKMEVADRGAKLTSSVPEISFAEINMDSWPVRLLQSATKDFQEKEQAARTFIFDIAREEASLRVNPLSSPANFLPADRAGALNACQLAARGAVASASRAGLRPEQSAPLLSGVSGDFLRRLLSLEPKPRRRGANAGGIARRIEKTIMGGEVRVEPSPVIGFPSFFFRPDGWDRDLPLTSAASAASETAPIVLYLRHFVRPGELLIIEEPESHLHPAKQAQLIRLLAAAVQEGVRILITTHSEWILEELANLVRMSALPRHKREGLDDPDVSLRPDQAGVWIFERDGDDGAANVREIELDEDISSYPAGFTRVTEKLYNRWVDIDCRISEAPGT